MNTTHLEEVLKLLETLKAQSVNTGMDAIPTVDFEVHFMGLWMYAIDKYSHRFSRDCLKSCTAAFIDFAKHHPDQLTYTDNALFKDFDEYLFCMD